MGQEGGAESSAVSSEDPYSNPANRGVHVRIASRVADGFGSEDLLHLTPQGRCSTGSSVRQSLRTRRRHGVSLPDLPTAFGHIDRMQFPAG